MEEKEERLYDLYALDEDIRILEKLIEDGKETFTDTKLADYEIQAIEHLIERVKELEVINKMQEYRISVIDERELIPKSKVKEKIEEIEAMSISKDIYYDDIKRLFEELLEEEKTND